MLCIVEVIQAAEGKSRELRKALSDIVPVCQKENGCLHYELFETTSKSGEFLIVMKWHDKDALLRHESAQHILDFVHNYEGVLYTEVTQYSEWKPVY